MYDVAIIGAGPAGAVLARLLGRTHRVLLVERHGEGDGGKCCGGLLTPEARAALAACGLEPPASVLADPQAGPVRILDLDNGLDRLMPRGYANCYRGKLEAWLRAQAREAELRMDTSLRGIVEDVDSLTLTLSAGGRQYIERARLLVGADGAASLVRKWAAPHQPRPTTYVALQAWYAGEAPPYHAAIFDAGVTDFYGWTISKAGQLVVGAALPAGGGAAARLERMTARLREYGYRFGELLRREAAPVLRPRVGDVWTGAGRVLLIGEAAGWINPSSAEGFSYAFRSASALAQALQAGVEGADARYHRFTAPLRAEIVRNGMKSAVQDIAWLRRPLLYAGTRPFVGEPQPVPRIAPGFAP